MHADSTVDVVEDNLQPRSPRRQQNVDRAAAGRSMFRYGIRIELYGCYVLFF